MKEIWKDIDGFNGFYQVSNLGEVRSRNGVRSLSFTKDGYVKVRLNCEGKDKTSRVHRLVAEAFIDNPNGYDTVNHIDGDKTNNKVSNLEWTDRSGQMNHAYRLGLKSSIEGTDNSQSKLSEDDVREIRRTYVRQSKEFGTVALAKKYGVTNRVIGLIANGKSYRNVK